MFFQQPLTCYIWELILQGADVSHIDIEEGPKLRQSNADPREGDVGQATAAVDWEEEEEEVDEGRRSVGEEEEKQVSSFMKMYLEKCVCVCTYST